MWLHWKYNKVFIWKVIINKWNYTSYLSSVPCSCGFFVLIFQLNFVKKCANASNIPWQYFKYHEWLCGTLKLNFLVNYIFVLQKLWIWRPFLKFCLYYLFGLLKNGSGAWFYLAICLKLRAWVRKTIVCLFVPLVFLLLADAH